MSDFFMCGMNGCKHQKECNEKGVCKGFENVKPTEISKIGTVVMKEESGYRPTRLDDAILKINEIIDAVNEIRQKAGD